MKRQVFVFPICRAALCATNLGYDHIVIYDHVLGAVHGDREPKLTGPYKENDPFHEPLVTYAFLADALDRHTLPGTEAARRAKPSLSQAEGWPAALAAQRQNTMSDPEFCRRTPAISRNTRPDPDADRR